MKAKINLWIVAMLVLVIGIIFTACKDNRNSTAQNEKNLPKTITVSGSRFVDQNKRQVILNGINIVSKNKEDGYIFQGGPELYENLVKWGVNCIRFIIIWDRLEPEPGVYNEEYLKEIDQRIALAEKNGLFVVLDMHQDLFSVKYSDGAPEWATLDEGKPHTTGAIWSDAYMMSEAVQTSFDNFWLNKPAPDGIGLQDHYASLWQHIAKRYADNSTVIGYDIMNEPFPGSTAMESTRTLLAAYGELHYSLTGETLDEAQLTALWADEKNRMDALKVLSDKENYHFVFSRLFKLNKEFETTYLQEMYQKVALAIREVDKNNILFLEHSYFSNTGVASSIERVSLLDGSPDPLVAYAPHGYDLVTDTEAVAMASKERVSYIYEQIDKKGKQLNMPVWLGEWGAFYGNSTSVIPTAKNAVNLIEKHLFGNAYWSYDPGTENLEYFKQILVRVYPAYTNGELICYGNDFDSHEFTMKWKEDKNNNAATMIFVPSLSKLDMEALREWGDVGIEKISYSDAGWLIVPPIKGEGQRVLTLDVSR
ncbi:cellulase family glycosylhydrolase [Flavobacteriaceae bacterium F89]|uniref:Cellulase family glycosylhydrolase n=1 Tax=Cerina litoralis TaxID=2874477 RepID=A0AAE3EXP2_9FLAO|nr:cellulase family glycosylhydrolase [Cerina litoralis]MCG2461496.1 cellulase family glycosylhydrolase [Cerina litoralis]